MKELFKSQLAFELLNELTQDPKKEHFLAQFASILGKDAANISRELQNLEEEGLINVRTQKKKKYYSYNIKSPIAKNVTELFEKVRAQGLNKKFDEEWMLAEDIPNMDPFFSQMWMNCFIDQFKAQGGKAYKKIGGIFKGYHLWFYFVKEDANAVGEHLVKRFDKDPRFMDKVNKKIIEYSDILRSFCEKLPEENLHKYTNRQLWSFYDRQEKIHQEYYEWGWIPVAVDMFCNNLTNYGKEILRKRGVKEKDINKYLALLSSPTKPSLLKIEQDEMNAIGIKVQEDKEQHQLLKELFRKFKEDDVKMYGLYTHSPEYEKKLSEKVRELKNKIRPDILADLENHYQKYFYMKFLFSEEQGIYNFEHYLKQLVRLVNGDPNIKKTVEKENKEIEKVILEKNSLIKKLKLNKKEIQIFNAWGDFMITKIYRRFAQIFAVYRMLAVLEEMAKRLGITVKELKFMTSNEIATALATKSVNREEIKKRTKFSAFYTDKNENMWFTGPDAKKAEKMLHKMDVKKVDQIEGQCGCQGTAKGEVKIVNLVEDMKKVNPGDILVSISTQPDLVPAMKKAAAFVTEQGGVTSHAAIVAREMKKPCVIGTKIATRVLKDGEIVEVDADKGVVRIVN